jgi:predicted protein tyrosine phosphatase
MIEVSKNLFVGSEGDCFNNREGWVVIHACKHPCHQIKVGYMGSLPKHHPRYLIDEDSNNLYLNLVDMEKELSTEFTDPIIKKAMEFIENNISSKKVLIHCNLGESRAPSIALIYLAKAGLVPKEDCKTAVEEFKKHYPIYSPKTGIMLYIKNNWKSLTG